MQAVAENFQISVSHLWSSQVIYPQTSDLDVVPGKGSRIPHPNTKHQNRDPFIMWDGCPWLVSVSCCGPCKEASEKFSNFHVPQSGSFYVHCLSIIGHVMAQIYVLLPNSDRPSLAEQKNLYRLVFKKGQNKGQIH